jgi:hypothetical protein
MERRRFLKLGLAFAASGMLVAKTLASAEAAPLLPVDPTGDRTQDNKPQPAVASQDDVNRLQPEQVQWRRRRYGWRRRAWRRRYWRPRAWRRRRVWRRRVWRRRYW